MSGIAPANGDIQRTETGEIKDQSQSLLTETKTAETDGTTKEQKVEPKAKEGESLLTQKDDKSEAKAGAPEKYEPFKVPEGFTLDEKVSGEINTMFKDIGLSQADGQKLVDYYTKVSQEAADAPVKHYMEMRKGWQDQIKADPDLGPKLPQVKATVAKAIDGLGNPKLAADFREAMDLTGAGDHPAFIRAFFALAQKVTEGTHVSGSGPSKFGQSATPRPESAAKAMYPHLT